MKNSEFIDLSCVFIGNFDNFKSKSDKVAFFFNYTQGIFYLYVRIFMGNS